jgi:hypothetical protein
MREADELDRRLDVSSQLSLPLSRVQKVRNEGGDDGYIYMNLTRNFPWRHSSFYEETEKLFSPFLAVGLSTVVWFTCVHFITWIVYLPPNKI